MRVLQPPLSATARALALAGWVALAASTFACGSSDDDGGGGGGGGGGNSTTTTLAPGPPTETQGSIADCGARTVDRYQLAVARNQLVDIELDTLDGATAADLCFKGRCGGVDVGGDDEVPCTAAPPSFACARTTITTRRAGACTVDVLPCSNACAASSAGYRLTIAAGGAGPVVELIADNASNVSGVCSGGTNDGESCEAPVDCEGGGTCAPLPAAPVRAVGDLPDATDVPPDASLTCSMALRMSGSVTYGNLKLKVDYGDARGGFPGRGREVSCERQVGGAGTFTDYDASTVLGVSLLNGTGIAGPRTLVTCPFVTSATTLDPTDFTVAVLDARSPTGAAIDPRMEVRVTCGGTTTSSTTTTVP